MSSLWEVIHYTGQPQGPSPASYWSVLCYNVGWTCDLKSTLLLMLLFTYISLCMYISCLLITCAASCYRWFMAKHQIYEQIGLFVAHRPKWHYFVCPGAKPFSCEYCHKNFRTSGHCSSHKRSHVHDGEDIAKKTRRPARKQPRADAAVLNEIQLQEPIQITEHGMHISFSALTLLWMDFRKVALLVNNPCHLFPTILFWNRWRKKMKRQLVKPCSHGK